MKNNNNILKLGRGMPIEQAADLAIKFANEKKSEIILAYNNVNIKVLPDTTQKYITNAFFNQAMSTPNLGMQENHENQRA